MASNFSSIGFPVTDKAQFSQLVGKAHELGSHLSCAAGSYVVWAPGGGPELWVAEGPTAPGSTEHQLLGVNPHFSGTARMKVGVVATRADAELRMEGMLSCWADPTGDEPETGVFPFDVFVPDFELHAARLLTPATVTLQIAAFARTLQAYADDAAFKAQQERFGGRGLAAQAFIPVGSFAGQAPSTALFAGHAMCASERVNPASGAHYHHVQVDTLGGQIDVVADPSVIVGSVVQGAIVRCDAWLSARLASPTPVP